MLKKLGQKLKNEKGLTLIELLAVIVILGIIAAIAIPSIGKIIENSKISAVKADAIQILNAAKIRYAENSSDKEISLEDLKGFLDEVPTFKDDTDAEVVVTDEGAFQFTGTGTKSGITVNFTSATVQMIDNAPKSARDIPATDVKEEEK
ncbi:prepilin-type N-terminal cleavage/methylation domain-containing protein [Bacillus infantis]|uniref:prepilin-type N-terminal cleavage/methylation domain-containing protein n=1 Tax=Bacillus infantis TaxID=324767 RepID=UPI001CD62368|nr:prepilin-type N-terminal cleavage/methylation domain-containing protein [Bacillus infantis]MCA1038942.1 prepilin-type N-terminal cleavage/methylation domain-containing protein [Bacillus infantis]